MEVLEQGRVNLQLVIDAERRESPLLGLRPDAAAGAAEPAGRRLGVRLLVVISQAAGGAESGLAVSVTHDPSAKTPLGVTARVAPTWGGDAMSGRQGLWEHEATHGIDTAGSPLLEGGGAQLDTRGEQRPAHEPAHRRDEPRPPAPLRVRSRVPRGIRE
jgi:hypothetical protein